jgi:hypothetical protein
MTITAIIIALLLASDEDGVVRDVILVFQSGHKLGL